MSGSDRHRGDGMDARGEIGRRIARARIADASAEREPCAGVGGIDASHLYLVLTHSANDHVDRLVDWKTFKEGRELRRRVEFDLVAFRHDWRKRDHSPPSPTGAFVDQQPCESPLSRTCPQVCPSPSR